MLSVLAQPEMPKIFNVFKKVMGPLVSLVGVKKSCNYFVYVEHKGEQMERMGEKHVEVFPRHGLEAD